MRHVKINFIERAKIVDEYKNGASAAALGEKYGCGENSVYRYLRAAEVELHHGQTPFDGDLADTMRKEYEAGATSTSLAAKYNTTKARVCRYIREAGGEIRTGGRQKAS